MFASARPPCRLSARCFLRLHFGDSITNTATIKELIGVRHQLFSRHAIWLMSVLVEMCSRHAGSVAAHCSKAAMFASARPPCRQSTRAVSCHQSSHKHRNCTCTNSISTGRLCGDVFASESAAKSIPARTAMPMTHYKTSNTSQTIYADVHANDFLQRKQRGQLLLPAQAHGHNKVPSIFNSATLRSSPPA